MILIAGAGFGGEVFDGFAKSYPGYTTYAVTLPGSGGSAAPPMPPDGTSYAEGSWIRGAEAGILDLIDTERLAKPVVVAHWLFATHVALRPSDGERLTT